MGLSGPRNRRKLDHDPNNTRWTRDETTFGQKILRAQGWEPGKYLGAQDSSHAQLHSAASFAPIKINLKDDTLGLGAKIRQKQSDECTGLDVFKDLLGRLNGKSEETLEKERQVRSEIKTNIVVERKYGPMRFVSGGLLVGDQMKMAELVDNKPASPPSAQITKDDSTPEVTEVEQAKKQKKEKKSKKRKAEESEEADTSHSKLDEKSRKRLKGESSGNDDTEGEKLKKKKDKKEKISKRSKKSTEEGTEAELDESDNKRKKSKKSKIAAQDDSPLDILTKTSQDAALEKAKRKEKKKDKKRKRVHNAESSIAATAISTSAMAMASSPQDSGTSTPLGTGASTPQVLSARHLARSRNIAAKKLAFGDAQALNQIFMVKPV
ncbi:hypothetical protein F5Y19DRAFT_10503 [Xylariaceae sp. FL1651]|nr:hypothetical protein F5Y19DRAFT_10503 [Xylariaceae sp. FL1651]